MSGRADLDRVSEIIGELNKIAAEVDKKKDQLDSQEILERKEYQEYLKKIDKDDQEDEAEFQKLALERENRRKEHKDRREAATEGREKARLACLQHLSRIQGEYPRPADHSELRMLLMTPGAGATSLQQVRTKSPRATCGTCGPSAPARLSVLNLDHSRKHLSFLSARGLSPHRRRTVGTADGLHLRRKRSLGTT